MVNFTQVSYFTLGAYFDPGPLRWLYFVIILSVYVLIVLSNLLLIVVICMNTTLHEPMYMFLCSLFINEINGSTVCLLFIAYQILQDFHSISYNLCFLQMFLLYSYGGVNFTNLAIMSYDRYVAICFPLHYNTHMTPRKVTCLIVVIWLSPLVAVTVTIVLTASLKLCGNILDSVYCDNYLIIKLACSDTTVNNIYELVVVTIILVIPTILIFFTYIQIFRVCFNGTKQTRQKALSTCTPHLFSVVNFAFGCSFQIFQSRFDLSHLPQMLRIILSLYHLTCQPLFNTPMYGLNLTKIRNVCKNIFCKSRNAVTTVEMTS
ncbi:olfactory receptor 11A1-like [Boleophthalmus pectinirostris]|uniref:olfactory receptor 11A1-like n=1 Tax=Boleophthalmus pectinirostris TaxID=150288 RepID=UPI00242FBA37|nr:olfactory receptor 11A1-like [Boleophthalmus pectinirostris]